jgi:hypothetical protein
MMIRPLPVLIFFQREWLIPVDQLSEDNNYLAEVSATDRGGRTSDKEVIDIVPNTLSEHEGQPASLKLTKLDGLTVNEIEKSGFVPLQYQKWSMD